RRLRRDLHDGLGPALAALVLKVGSARALYPRDPATADALLLGLEADLAGVIGEIRRLVYNLRPPALHGRGLVAAIGACVADDDAALGRGAGPSTGGSAGAGTGAGDSPAGDSAAGDSIGGRAQSATPDAARARPAIVVEAPATSLPPLPAAV